MGTIFSGPDSIPRNRGRRNSFRQNLFWTQNGKTGNVPGKYLPGSYLILIEQVWSHFNQMSTNKLFYRDKISVYVKRHPRADC